MGLWNWLLGSPRAAEFAGGRGWVTPVVGESHYQEELGRQYRANGGSEHDVKVIAVLQPEPGNPFDPNAVAVHVGGDLVGYLPRDLAAEYSQVMGQTGGSCSAKIVGGFLLDGGRRASFGVRLNLRWPPKLR